MSEYFFNVDSAEHVCITDACAKRLEAAAAKAVTGATFTAYRDRGTGRWRSWFSVPNRGAPFDQSNAREVLAAVATVPLTYQRGHKPPRADYGCDV